MHKIASIYETRLHGSKFCKHLMILSEKNIRTIDLIKSIIFKIRKLNYIKI